MCKAESEHFSPCHMSGQKEMSFLFEKVLGREAVCRVERAQYLHRADLSLNPESWMVTQLWAY